jgi:CRISPR-associated protein Cmr3
VTGSRFFVLVPTDTLFFRDGRPYNQDDAGLAYARSLFPPYPSTLSGALRAALALGQGWDGRSSWSSRDLLSVLGDGPQMTDGTLWFDAPVLLRRDGAAWEPLYAAPRMLVGAKEFGSKEFGSLRPGPPLDCDLGPAVRLLVDPSGRRRKVVAEAWLNRTALQRLLDDQAEMIDTADVVKTSDLWAFEPRLGLELENTSRTAKPGQLYAPVHVRPAAGVALGQCVAGVPEAWIVPKAVPLGGENRTAMLDTVPPPPALPRATRFRRTADGTRQCVTLTLLSPASVESTWLRPGPVRHWDVEILSACLGDPLPIGGWDSRPRFRGPRPLRPFLPAGSTWFLHTPLGWTEPCLYLGDEADARHGFGRFVLGTFADTDADRQGAVP